MTILAALGFVALLVVLAQLAPTDRISEHTVTRILGGLALVVLLYGLALVDEADRELRADQTRIAAALCEEFNPGHELPCLRRLDGVGDLP